MQYLHSILITLLILTSFLVFLSENPVHSVLFLILTFCEASAILFMFGVEFLGILFIIIYVGAIAVLFLFVVMMLNVKVYNSQSFSFIPFVSFIVLLLSFQLSGSLTKVFLIKGSASAPSTFLIFECLTNIDTFGQALYNNYLICFLLAGFVLLVAMVGAITLTLTFNSLRKNELAARQLSSSGNVLSRFH